MKYDHESENTRDIQVLSLSIPENVDLDTLKEVMDRWYDANVQEAKDIQQTLSVMYQSDITYDCALDVQYLRTRSRWTEAREAELIKLHIAGTPPNICEWP